MSVDINTYTEQMLTQMALVQGAISTVGVLDSATQPALDVVYEAVADALAPFNAAIAAYEADIDTTSVGGVVSGIAPPTMSDELLVQADDVTKEADLIVARAYLSRIGASVKSAPG